MVTPQLDENKALRQWTEAGIALHLITLCPPEQIHTRLLSYAFSEWMQDIPSPDFSHYRASQTASLSTTGIVDGLITNAGGSMTPAVLAESIDAIRDAIKSNDWSQFELLPQPVWGWITSSTGLSQDGWKKLPAATSKVLDATFTCPSCNKAGKLADIIKFDYLDTSTNNALTCRCKDCDMLLSVDTQFHDLTIVKPVFPGVQKVMKYAIVAIVALMLFAFIYALTHKASPPGPINLPKF